jgi:hypothetical protein
MGQLSLEGGERLSAGATTATPQLMGLLRAARSGERGSGRDRGVQCSAVYRQPRWVPGSAFTHAHAHAQAMRHVQGTSQEKGREAHGRRGQVCPSLKLLRRQPQDTSSPCVVLAVTADSRVAIARHSIVLPRRLYPPLMLPPLSHPPRRSR